jgi:hypothetical protein
VSTGEISDCAEVFMLSLNKPLPVNDGARVVKMIDDGGGGCVISNVGVSEFII